MSELTVHAANALITPKGSAAPFFGVVYVEYPYGSPRYFAYWNGAARRYVELRGGRWCEV